MTVLVDTPTWRGSTEKSQAIVFDWDALPIRKVAHVACMLLGMHMHVCVNMHVTVMPNAHPSKGNMHVTCMLQSCLTHVPVRVTCMLRAC